MEKLERVQKENVDIGQGAQSDEDKFDEKDVQDMAGERDEPNLEGLLNILLEAKMYPDRSQKRINALFE